MLIPSIDLLGGQIVQLVQGENCVWPSTTLNSGLQSFQNFLWSNLSTWTRPCVRATTPPW